MQNLKKKLNFENSKIHLESLIETCSLFNQKSETYDIVMRPGFYYYPHMKDEIFIDENMNQEVAKKVMSPASQYFKLMIVPYSKLTNPETNITYLSIAIKEEHSNHMPKEILDQLTYIPSQQAIRYLYSRPFSNERFHNINSIYERLLSDGYCLSKDIIYIENSVDFYCDDIRYENYFIYFPLDKS